MMFDISLLVLEVKGVMMKVIKKGGILEVVEKLLMVFIIGFVNVVVIVVLVSIRSVVFL